MGVACNTIIATIAKVKHDAPPMLKKQELNFNKEKTEEFTSNMLNTERKKFKQLGSLLVKN